MSIDFSLVLLVLSGITGVIWLFDIFYLQKPREVRLDEYLNKNNMTREEFENVLDYEENAGDKDHVSISIKKVVNEGLEIQQESVPVEYAKSFFPIIFAVLILRSFLFEPFQIPSGSMIPTLNIGDFIVVNKFAYGVRLPVIGTKIIDIDDPKRGDVMVFIPPHQGDYYIKRVIGLPGDHVRYENKVIYINEEPLEQEYVDYLEDGRPPVVHSLEAIGGINHDIHTVPGPDFRRPGNWLRPEGMIIPEGYYFMMGDNRDNSSDSRVWGPASENKIVGKAVAVWLHKDPGWNLPTFSQNRLIANP